MGEIEAEQNLNKKLDRPAGGGRMRCPAIGGTCREGAGDVATIERVAKSLAPWRESLFDNRIAVA